ncbi:hypothetical protein K0M31_001606 [Melipona bicolor]|uniref:Odorant receptor n=1 Tax=Melipona bicolor TaxID=60889 RepID=A0AA40GGN5_9HYME|nr:hypothetical protein K0M31_001606 [Melipona bicolor]
MAIHLTGQFRILRYRFSKMCDVEYEISEKDEESMLTRHAYRIYKTFKKYVRHHQALISYCKMLENVYTMIILGQVLVFSMLICLFGYQVLLAKTTAARRSVFIFLLIGAMSLLFMFTYSCDGVIEHSDNVAIGSHSAMWTIMPMNEYGKMLRNDIIMLVVSQCDMSSVKTDDISISLTAIFMKLVGLWMASNRSEQRVRNITVGYTLIAIVFAFWVQTTDIYYSWGDFSKQVIQTSVSANIGRNETDRVLPFNMWIDLPLTTTPYYEITFVLQVLSFHNFITTEPPTSEELKKDKKCSVNGIFR